MRSLSFTSARADTPALNILAFVLFVIVGVLVVTLALAPKATGVETVMNHFYGD